MITPHRRVIVIHDSVLQITDMLTCVNVMNIVRARY